MITVKSNINYLDDKMINYFSLAKNKNSKFLNPHM